MHNLTQYSIKSFRFVLLLLCLGFFVACRTVDTTGTIDTTDYAYICPFGISANGTTDIENTEQCVSCDDEYDLEESRCVQSCTVGDFATKLQEDVPNVLGCSIASIEIAIRVYFDDLLELDILISTLVPAFPNATILDLLNVITTIDLLDAQLDSSFLDLCTFPLSSTLTYCGVGTKQNPYLILTATQLQDMDRTDNLNSHFIIGRDIDLSTLPDGTFSPIGGDTDTDAFTGSLDGRNFTISNLEIDESTGERVGLFSTLSGNISNLTIVDATVNARAAGGKAVGTLVGYQLVDSVIKNIVVSGRVSSASFISPTSESYSGGLVAYQNGGGSIISSVMSGTLSSTSVDSPSAFASHSYSGGLVAYQDGGGSISSSIMSGTVSSSSRSESYSGGLVAYQNRGGTVTSSVISGILSSSSQFNSYSGGLVAYQNRGGSISSSIMSGTVSSFAVHSTNSRSYSAGLVGLQVRGGTVSFSQSFSVLYARGALRSHVGGLAAHMYAVEDNQTMIERSLFYGVGVGVTSMDTSVGSHAGAQSGSFDILRNNLVISESVFFDAGNVVTEQVGGTARGANICNVQTNLADVLSTTDFPMDCDDISTPFFGWSGDNWSLGTLLMLPYLGALNQSEQFYVQGSGLLWLYSGTVTTDSSNLFNISHDGSSLSDATIDRTVYYAIPASTTTITFFPQGLSSSAPDVCLTLTLTIGIPVAQGGCLELSVEDKAGTSLSAYTITYTDGMAQLTPSANNANFDGRDLYVRYRITNEESDLSNYRVWLRQR